TCPPHTVPLGGGAFVASSSTAVNLNSSFPTAVGWVVDLNNGSDQATAFAVLAVCARTPNRYTVVPSTVDNPRGTQSRADAVCPTGTKILGGGGFSNAGLGVNESSNSIGGDGWRIEQNNATGGDAQVTAFAICGKVKGWRVAIGTTIQAVAGIQSF